MYVHVWCAKYLPSSTSRSSSNIYARSKNHIFGYARARFHITPTIIIINTGLLSSGLSSLASIHLQRVIDVVDTFRLIYKYICDCVRFYPVATRNCRRTLNISVSSLIPLRCVRVRRIAHNRTQDTTRIIHRVASSVLSAS